MLVLPLGPPRRSPTRRWLALAVLCLSLLIVTLDNTVLNVALPTLVRDLGATSSQLQWIVDAYVIVFAGLILVSGSLADRFGRQRMFMLGLLLFAAGSSWAAYSGSVGMLIAARASMGVGGSLIMPSTLAIITDVFTNPGERPRAFGFWAATSGAGVALGPIVGGLLLAHFWWGSVFLINVPIAVIAIGCALWLVPDSKDPAALGPDLVGSLLSIAGLGLLLWAIIDAPVEGWTSAVVIGAGIGGLVVLTLFVIWERLTSHPMLRLDFFRNRSFSTAIFSLSLVMFGLFGALFILTQYLQFYLHFSALATGVRIIPAAGAIAIIAPLSTPLDRRLGTRVIVAVGLLVVAAGLWQISTATVTTTYWGTLWGMVMLGVGAGLAIPAVTGAVMGSLPRRHTGIGSATNGAFLQIGGAVGVAVIGSILSTHYQNQMTPFLVPLHLPAAMQSTILGSIGGALDVAHRAGGMLGQVLAGQAGSAFIGGMDVALRAGALVALVGGLLALIALPTRQQGADESDGAGEIEEHRAIV